MLILLWAFLFSQFLWASDSNEIDITELRKVEAHYIRGDIKKTRIEKERFAKELKKKVELKTILTSGVHLAGIPRGSILIDINTDEEYELPKTLTVRLFRQIDSLGYKYIQDKNGQARFKVYAEQTSTIEHVADLKPKPLFWQEEKLDRSKKTYDPLPNYALQFNAHGEYMEAPFARELLPFNQGSYAWSSRYEAIALVKWNFPVQVGASINYQIANLESLENNKAQIYNLSTGPYFRFAILKQEEKTWMFNVSMQKSIFTLLGYDTPYEYTSTLIDTYTLQLGIETQTDENNILTPIVGKLNYGVAYRHQWFSVNDSVEAFQYAANESEGDSIGLYLGKEFDL